MKRCLTCRPGPRYTTRQWNFSPSTIESQFSRMANTSTTLMVRLLLVYATATPSECAWASIATPASIPVDVFRFTLYWTIVLYVPAFVLCGFYAFLNLSFPPRKPPRKSYRTRPPLQHVGSSYRSGTDSESIPLRRYERQTLGAGGRGQSQFHAPSRSPAKQNERRSRLTFALLVFLWFAVFALGGAVVGSAIIGYVLAWLFSSAKYNMSTYVCFLVHRRQTGSVTLMGGGAQMDTFARGGDTDSCGVPCVSVAFCICVVRLPTQSNTQALAHCHRYHISATNSRHDDRPRIIFSVMACIQTDPRNQCSVHSCEL